MKLKSVKFKPILIEMVFGNRTTYEYSFPIHTPLLKRKLHASSSLTSGNELVERKGSADVCPGLAIDGEADGCKFRMAIYLHSRPLPLPRCFSCCNILDFVQHEMQNVVYHASSDKHDRQLLHRGHGRDHRDFLVHGTVRDALQFNLEL